MEQQKKFGDYSDEDRKKIREVIMKDAYALKTFICFEE